MSKSTSSSLSPKKAKEVSRLGSLLREFLDREGNLYNPSSSEKKSSSSLGKSSGVEDSGSSGDISQLRKYLIRFRQENSTGFITTINSELQDLVPLKNVKGGSEDLEKGKYEITSPRFIKIINLLIDLTENEPRKISVFSNFLRMAISNCRSNTPLAIISQITKTVGKLAKESVQLKTLTAKWVHYECTRALEWITHNDKRMHVSLLVLKELAENSQTLFFSHAGEFFKSIWVGLRDSNETIRQTSLQALIPVLELVGERHCQDRTFWYHELVKEVQNGFQKNKVERIHSSLLVTAQLVIHVSTNLMKSFYNKLCTYVIKFCSHRDKAIKVAAIKILPILANFDKEKFTKMYLEKAMTEIFKIFRYPQIKKEAYLALGELVLVCGREETKKYLEKIIGFVIEGMNTKNRKYFVDEALKCLALLAQTMKDSLKDDIIDIIKRGIMFNNGITEDLIFCLDSLAKSIPSLLKPIQMRLLDCVSVILSKKPFRPIIFEMGDKKDKKVYINPSETLITMALLTLSRFNMRGHNLTDFVCEYIIHYLNHKSSAIKKLVITTCCNILNRELRSTETKEIEFSYEGYEVGRVIDKLLSTGITDPDPSIRSAVINNLHKKFDRYLALSSNLKLLMICLNDDNFEIREKAMKIVGRVSNRNPSFILANLRSVYLQTLTNLQYNEEIQKKEESAKFLGHIILASPSLTRPYLPFIYKVLKENITLQHTSVSTHVIDSIGKLAVVEGPEMAQYFGELLPLFVTTLERTSSSRKREIIIRSLGNLVRNTGNVITPYQKQPNLLQVLLDILKREEKYETRREILSVLGIIGAIDPFVHKNIVSRTNDDEIETGEITEKNENILLKLKPSSDGYYSTIAFLKLMEILKDQALLVYHCDVIQAVMFIFRSLGMRCVPYLKHVMQPFFKLIRTSEDQTSKITLFQQLGVLINIIKHHIRNYVDDIMDLCRDNWKGGAKIQIMGIWEELCQAMGEEFQENLSKVIPKIINVVKNSKSTDRAILKNCVVTIRSYSKYLFNYLHLIIPCVIGIIENIGSSEEIIVEAIKTMDEICLYEDVRDFCSRIIHPLIKIFKTKNSTLCKYVLHILCTLIYKLKKTFLLFEKCIDDSLSEVRGIANLTQFILSYESLLVRLKTSKNCFFDLNIEEIEKKKDRSDKTNAVTRIHVNEANLKKAWEARTRSAKEDWAEWFRQLSVELLKESPSPALRACSQLAQFYQPVSKSLFNAAFLSCWCELKDSSKGDLIRSIEQAFGSQQLPSETLQALLNLAEFMEHDEKPLPIAINSLGYFAGKCQSYAKALRYKEREFLIAPELHIDNLISIYDKLRQRETAMGVLRFARNNPKIEFKDIWYEKLQRWDEALKIYTDKQRDKPSSLKLALGRMRCLDALGNWKELGKLAHTVWDKSDNSVKKKLADITSQAAWGLSEWNFMEETVKHLESNERGCFFKAVLAIRKKDYKTARKMIEQSRKLLDVNISALVGESYNRAYESIFLLQELVELEDVIEYKTYPNKRQLIKQTWNARLHGVSHTVDKWKRMLLIKQLCLEPTELIDEYVHFAELSRDNEKVLLSDRIFRSVLIKDFDPKKNPEMLLDSKKLDRKIVFNYFQQMWHEGSRKKALSLISEFVKKRNVDGELLAQSHLLIGRWNVKLHFSQENFDESRISQITRHFQKSSGYNKSWYKPWHYLGIFNYVAANYFAQEGKKLLDEELRKYKKEDHAVQEKKFMDEKKVEELKIEKHLCSSIFCFFKSIKLNEGTMTKDTLQDILRLLTLWFNYGGQSNVNKELKKGFNSLNVDLWLNVIPQIIARINSHEKQIRSAVCDLVLEIGMKHPQALVYPLSVSAKSVNISRKEEADKILTKLMNKYPVLVEQADVISRELIRIAILWEEKWHNELENFFYGHQNVPELLRVLTPLYEKMKNPVTSNEINFKKNFDRTLIEAYKWCKIYEKTQLEADLSKGCNLFYTVYSRIKKQLPNITILEMKYISPKLEKSRELDLAVPGSYLARGFKEIKIGSFVDKLEVLSSKHRPRKIKIADTDNSPFLFLLKGHEDQRQDERVMQLFGLVNTLLKNNPQTQNKNLSIRRYSVIPLSANEGLLGWVLNCDTLHSLIKEYRDSKGIIFNIEHRLLKKKAPFFNNLNIMQKIEAFEYTLDNTSGKELKRIMWLKSSTSERWLDRRTHFTRSLAVMSMVGYILGLGDRHPNNILITQKTGKVVHIDFGDCFEVAIRRENFPEKVPFRLTRMLVNAMEAVCGVEGTYRSTCEKVMKVLRFNKNSLMAMLEAFVYDPLVNWRYSRKKGIIKPLINNSKILNNKTMHAKNSDSSSGSTASGQGDANKDEQLGNKKALNVIKRIENKLVGKDFTPHTTLEVEDQVSLLIEEATKTSNLCQAYIGWCAFW